MPPASSFPDHPSRRRNSSLHGAFDRLVREDRLLGSMAGRHCLHRDLRITFLTVLGPPVVWLLSGRPLPAGVTAVGFGALLALCLWTASTHGLPEASRLLTTVRWLAVAMVAVGLLVVWGSVPAGGSPAPHPGPGPVISPIGGLHYRSPAPGQQ
jgi:hypothetical protein